MNATTRKLIQGTTEAPDERGGHPGSCERRNRWFGGCKFEARYDYGVPQVEGLSYTGGGLQRVLDQMREKTYICDVCVRCGKTIGGSK
jgi:hypothetical protein